MSYVKPETFEDLFLKMQYKNKQGVTQCLFKNWYRMASEISKANQEKKGLNVRKNVQAMLSQVKSGRRLLPLKFETAIIALVSQMLGQEELSRFKTDLDKLYLLNEVNQKRISLKLPISLSEALVDLLVVVKSHEGPRPGSSSRFERIFRLGNTQVTVGAERIPDKQE